LFDLSGKIALITGSSSGLGFTLAKGLGFAGASIVLNGRNKEKLKNSVRILQDEGITCNHAPFDITNEKEVIAGIEFIEGKIGAIDILINNAGLQHRQPLENISVENWQKVIDVNLTGAFVTSKHVAKRMIKRKSGKIINICSLMSEVGRETIAPYTASKGGLKMLTKGMAVDWGKYNIQVNGIGPGYFITEMTQPLADDPEFDGWVKKRTPAKRWGRPEELIGTAVYLCSNASNFVNGQIIYVDGGILATI
jgi:gluconate 5-dehydrogenase